MDKQHFEDMLGDVAKHFASPEDLAASADFTRSQKIELLRQWEYDEQLKLTASEENMTGNNTDATATSADKVTKIRNLMKELGAEHDPEASGPGKVGTPVVNK